ncbi:MAG: cell envelope integrity protein CreD [Saprospiraceae bacterium]|nr:cell envelope integrity protein CreD [Saprospiraceae bacterium]
MENQENSVIGRFGHWVQTSLLVKLASIGFLTLVLLIPNVMIQDLVRERQNRQSEAISEVSASWGAAQTVTGPVLSIPYSEWVQMENDKRVESIQTAYFLPQALRVNGKVDPELRKRGIYEIVLYQSDLMISGTFDKPDFAALNIRPEDVHWDQAKLSLGIAGMSGIKNSIQLDWAGMGIRLEPGTANSKVLLSGVSNAVPVDAETEAYAFSIPLKLNGSGYLKFEPVGKETTVALESGWSSPSFEGDFLPDQREIRPEGFSASWKVLDLNRNYPQQWKGAEYSFGTGNHPSAHFGVRLVQTVDEYAKTERSSKYAILVIGLTFLIYFFYETLRRFHIHPFQYLLVGLALSVFYLLLLSLSEHLGFNTAYALATAATIGLIAVYSAGVFKNLRMTVQLTLLLGLIYGFIFIVLQLEDYALLTGSIGIFAALAAVMYYSRNVDWYNLSETAQTT